MCLADNPQSMQSCIRFDLECAAVCRTAARLVARGGMFSIAACRLCALACDACARECASFAAQHCQSCANACLACAQACRHMDPA